MRFEFVISMKLILKKKFSLSFTAKIMISLTFFLVIARKRGGGQGVVGPPIKSFIHSFDKLWGLLFPPFARQLYLFSEPWGWASRPPPHLPQHRQTRLNEIRIFFCGGAGRRPCQKHHSFFFGYQKSPFCLFLFLFIFLFLYY